MSQYVIGLCGSQGTGKTSILSGVERENFKVDRSQIARTAQKNLGWDSLSRVEESVENMHALQEAVLNAMYDRDKAINDSGTFTLVERTPADVWAYTQVWCDRLHININTDEWVLSYKQKCRNLANAYAHFVHVPITDKVKFVVDPNRADAKSRVDVDSYIKEFILSGGLNFHELHMTSIVDRVNETVTLFLIKEIEEKHEKTGYTNLRPCN